MTDTSTTVVIGAGHNGLTCAAYLAKSGMRVLVLETSAEVGGACITDTFSDGYSVSRCAHYVTMLHPQIVKDLHLVSHGLSYAATNLETISLSQRGAHIRISGDTVTGAALAARDTKDFAHFHARMTRFSKVLAATFVKRPPRLMNNDLKDKLSLIKMALDVRRLGRQDMRELLRIGAINIYDVLEENFDDAALKGALCVDGVLGSHMGPRSPNTVLGFMYRHVGNAFGFAGPALPSGGMGAVSDALSSAATSLGAEIRTNACVQQILTEKAAVIGVRLAGGEVIETNCVISNADPKTTFSSLVGYPQLETGFARRIHNIRMQGSAAKLHLALDSLPNFTGLSETETGSRLVIAPDLTYVEKAFDDGKYGGYSKAPIIEISIPSVHDKKLAPTGKHVLSAVVQYAPYDLKEGWRKAKDRFKQVVIDLIDSYAPGLKQLIVASELLSPQDIETMFRITGGHWHHGELALDQILMLRPVPGASQYATPIDGLYLCGAGCHPGGGVMGLAGRNCAQAVSSLVPEAH